MFRRFALLIVLLLAVTAVNAQSSWSQHTRAAELAFARGDQELAEREFRASLKLAQSFRAGDVRLERSLENLARLLEYQTRTDEAQPMYELLLAAQEHRLGTSSPALLDTLAGLGRVALGAGDVPIAEANLRRYVGIADRSGSADPSQLRTVLSLLKRMATLAERHEEAVQMQRRIADLALSDSMLLPGEQANYVEALIQMELTTGDPNNVPDLVERVVELRSRGEGSEPAASVWARTAAAAASAAESTIAESAANRALELNPGPAAEKTALKALVDVSWLQVQRSQATMADLVALAGDNEDLQLADQRLAALRAWEAAHGTPEGSDSTKRLAHIKALRGQFSEVVDYQREAVAQARQEGGEELLQELEGLCLVEQGAGLTSEALATNTELLGLLEAEHGKVHLSLIPVLERQLNYHTELGDKKKARAAKRRLKKLNRKLT